MENQRASQRNANRLILKWQGGSGLYQLQSRTNLTTGAWQNAGTPTANTSATNTVSSTIFYRVQSLPNLSLGGLPGARCRTRPMGTMRPAQLPIVTADVL